MESRLIVSSEKLTFGQLVQQRRFEKGLTLLATAEQAGIDSATISRVENDRIQITLINALHLASCLGITISDLITELQLRKSELSVVDTQLVKQKGTPANGNVVNVVDIRNFLELSSVKPEAAKALLSWLLKKVFDLAEKFDQEIIGDLPLLTDEGVLSLLSYGQIYQVEFQYPNGLTSKTVVDVFEAGGAIIKPDVTFYFEQLKKNFFLGHKTNRSFVTLIDRLESVSVEKVKLNDVLALDEILNQEGAILGLYWNACAFSEEVTSNRFRLTSLGEEPDTTDQIRKEIKIAVNLVKISRWLQYLKQEDYSWIEQFRASLT